MEAAMLVDDTVLSIDTRVGRMPASHAARDM